MSFWRIVNATCQVSVVGGVAAAVNYRYRYSNMSTSEASTLGSVTTFSEDTRRDIYDVAIVGGGIVGVATARELLKRYPRAKVMLLEKEADVAQHQSGHNSGCIHAGMFYPPGSQMARLCPRGHGLMIDYCKKNNLPYELCGKLLVASKDSEVPTIERLYEWGNANGVKQLKMLRSEKEIQAIEPAVVGVAALWSPLTGIADFAEVTRHMYRELYQKYRNFHSQFQFEAQDFVTVQTPKGRKGDVEEMVLIRGRESGHDGPEKTIMARRVITCCGLSNDVVARHSGNVLSRIGSHVTQTYSFRGRYYQMVPQKRDIVKAHVYPAPDSSKGLNVGVHFTRTVDVRRGRQLIIGPGSAFAFDRYGYTPYQVDLEYCYHSAFCKGGWVSLFQNFRTILETYYMDLSAAAFLRDAQKLIPSVTKDDIEYSFCGVMGIGVSPDGKLNMDLAIEVARPRAAVPAEAAKKLKYLPKTEAPAPSETPLILNVRNAPSPAATCSMAIAEDIVDAAAKYFAL